MEEALIEQSMLTARPDMWYGELAGWTRMGDEGCTEILGNPCKCRTSCQHQLALAGFLNHQE